jgi:hypothetical protein
VSLGPAFETRAFGPFLVVRTTEPVGNAVTFMRATAIVELEGMIIGVGDASLNRRTAAAALDLLRARD